MTAGSRNCRRQRRPLHPARSGRRRPWRDRRGRLAQARLDQLVGFLVIPAIGFFVGFPLGVCLEELRRRGRHASAWRSTIEALRAMGLSILIELSATVLAAGAWLAAVLI